MRDHDDAFLQPEGQGVAQVFEGVVLGRFAGEGDVVELESRENAREDVGAVTDGFDFEGEVAQMEFIEVGGVVPRDAFAG